MTLRLVTSAAPRSLDRNEAIARIRDALRRRSGKAWSVTGGRGTAWGWITIDAAPARRTWIWAPREGKGDCPPPGLENWQEVDSGKPNSGHTGPADRAELAKLLGLESVHEQGVSVAAGNDYRREYVDRAEGHEPSVIGEPYWD